MFHVLLFLLGFVAVETNRRHLICSAPKVEAFYEMCDDSFIPVVNLEPCELSTKVPLNWSFTGIPKKNIDRLYSVVQVAKESVTVSERRYDLCSGADDEYDFCGALKGETVSYSSRSRIVKRMLFLEGVYTFKVKLFVGEEELLACFLVTLKVKAPVI
ncbi:lymphocyte antigen 96-like [Leptodactylus fuscus]|uniref:lymphocyte antigen 96-like n=1 Tax=Leptodactylus fuscus TaxID=238119 RepID=UPI003F4E7F7F